MVKDNTYGLIGNFSGIPGTKSKMVLRSHFDIFCQHPAARGTERCFKPLMEFSGNGVNPSVIQDAGTVSPQKQPKAITPALNAPHVQPLLPNPSGRPEVIRTATSGANPPLRP